MINENLRKQDLRHFVSKIVTIDSHKSKIGDDEDVVTLCFNVDQQDPAKDLEHFIEMGYDFVLDADVSPGETDNGVYQVFVEIERGRRSAKQIKEILDGLSKLTGIDNWRFRYFKGFKSQEATEENLEKAIPLDKETYEATTTKFRMENFSNFFSSSYADQIELLDESIRFKKIYGDNISFNIITSGLKEEVYQQITGPIMLESQSMAEIMFLTKYIGNFNITKIGNTFIFENSNWAVALERKK
jgi:hypothetical protein